MIWSKNRTDVRAGLSILALVLLMAACDVFDVANPQAITEDDLEDPSMMQAIADGAAATFADAYHNVIVTSELAADAIIWTGSETRNQQVDQGIWVTANSSIDIAYNMLSVARWTADDVIKRLNSLDAGPSASEAIASSHLYLGYSLVLLGDHFTQFTIDGGAPMEGPEAYRLAVEHFTEASSIAQSAGAQALAAAALGGRARAHHWLGIESGDVSEYAAAQADAEAALTLDYQFVFLIDYGYPARANEWWGNMQDELELGMGAPFRQLQDPVSGQLDPRVPISDYRGVSPNGADSLFFQEKYPSAESDIALVKWQEMSLIIAEVEWRNDNLQAAVDAINDVRQAAGLIDFSSSSSQSIRDQLIYERGAEFFLEGRRWPDARRFTMEFVDVAILPDDRWLPEAQLESPDRKWEIPKTERESNPGVS